MDYEKKYSIYFICICISISNLKVIWNCFVVCVSGRSEEGVEY